MSWLIRNVHLIKNTWLYKCFIALSLWIVRIQRLLLFILFWYFKFAIIYRQILHSLENWWAFLWTMNASLSKHLKTIDKGLTSLQFNNGGKSCFNENRGKTILTFFICKALVTLMLKQGANNWKKRKNVHTRKGRKNSIQLNSMKHERNWAVIFKSRCSIK